MSMIVRALRDRRHRVLVRRVQGGDLSAFGTLYDETYGLAAAYAGRRLASEADVEDIIAATFHCVLERIGDFDPARGSFVAFVLAIARSRLVDLLRARHRGDARDDSEDVIEESPDALARLIEGETRRDLARAIGELPAGAREVLRLRFAEELAHREIACVIGVGEEAVRQRLSRALGMLRTRMRSISGTEMDAEDTTPCTS
jgi:RNA polymerase sigma-70 factor, ECF subfamily